MLSADARCTASLDRSVCGGMTEAESRMNVLTATLSPPSSGAGSGGGRWGQLARQPGEPPSGAAHWTPARGRPARRAIGSGPAIPARSGPVSPEPRNQGRSISLLLTHLLEDLAGCWTTGRNRWRWFDVQQAAGIFGWLDDPGRDQPFERALHVPGRDEARYEPSPVGDIHRLPFLHEVHVDAGVLAQFPDADAVCGLGWPAQAPRLLLPPCITHRTTVAQYVLPVPG